MHPGEIKFCTWWCPSTEAIRLRLNADSYEHTRTQMGVLAVSSPIKILVLLMKSASICARDASYNVVIDICAKSVDESTIWRTQATSWVFARQIGWMRWFAHLSLMSQIRKCLNLGWLPYTEEEWCNRVRRRCYETSRDCASSHLGCCHISTPIAL